MAHRDKVIVSLHPHNDRGCAVADSELGLLAGADRIEGTLFGNGERTGNVDIITLALNMYTHGVDPKLNFSNLPEVTEAYERNTRMHVYERQPYSGALVFAAFSGSHQDAIAKGMTYRDEQHSTRWTVPYQRQPYSGALVFAAFSGSHQDAIAKGMTYRDEQHSTRWTVPYLPIDPTDLGRQYDKDVIRINSQSGKGGIGYVLEQKYGYDLPKGMREDLGYTVKDVSDHQHKELSAEEVYSIFKDTYVNIEDHITLPDYHFEQVEPGVYQAHVTIDHNGAIKECAARGNGRFDAICNAIKSVMNTPYTDLKYGEHALEHGSTSKAAAYVGITLEGNGTVWGAGIDNDIIVASVKALVSAINRSIK